MAAQIIAVANNKGGSGKTTVSINMAHFLASKKSRNRVLLIDLDSQCNATDTFIKRQQIEYSLYDLISSEMLQVPQVIQKTETRSLHILPNVPEYSFLEIELMKEFPESAWRLKDKAGSYIRENFDYVIIDTPPVISYSVYSALYLSDFVIVPVEPEDVDSIKGLNRVVSLIESIREQDNPSLRFMRLLVNNVDKRKSLSKEIQSRLAVRFENQIFKTMIPTSAFFPRAKAKGQTILMYAPTSGGAQAYRDLANEVRRITKAEEVTTDGET